MGDAHHVEMEHGPTEGQSGGTPSIADVRVRLEGQLEPIERAKEVFPRLLAKLSQRAKERELPIDVTELSEALHLERVLAPALAQLHQRSQAEAWPAKSWPLRLAQEVETLRAALRDRVRASTLPRAVSLEEALVEAKSRASSEPLVTLHTGTPWFGWLLFFPNLPFGVYLGIRNVMRGGSWWMLPMVVGASLVQPAIVGIVLAVTWNTRPAKWLGIDLAHGALVLWRGARRPRNAQRITIGEGDAVELQRHEYKGNRSYRLRLVRAYAKDAFLKSYPPERHQEGVELGRELAAKLSVPFREET